MIGKRPKKKPRRGEGPKPDINVTPLVDIVLVLLIIFMVVTPALAQGETIQLPEVLRIDKLAKDADPIKLIVSANGSLLLNGKKVDRAELEERLRKLHAADPNRSVLLNTDVRLRYVHVREMLALLQNIGFKGVSLKVAPRKAE
jgi:biopolymer transport protein ExbD/biopolymer transport protein TolR